MQARTPGNAQLTWYCLSTCRTVYTRPHTGAELWQCFATVFEKPYQKCNQIRANESCASFQQCQPCQGPAMSVSFCSKLGHNATCPHSFCMYTGNHIPLQPMNNILIAACTGTLRSFQSDPGTSA
eukprot:1159358-Pelagomonas_calceolata.AAC.3